MRRQLRRNLGYPSSSSSRPSACPALTRIVAARDGGLCRVKLPGGQLLAQQALAIADAAQAYASGVVELTNRANLQLRGVNAGAGASLIRHLSDAGLGPRIRANESIDPEQAERQAAVADDARNLLISPTAGLDAYALYDTPPLAEQLLALLQNEPRLAELSPKFSVLLDGGERLAALDHPHDVWFAAMAPAVASEAEAETETKTELGRRAHRRFAVGLAGPPSAIEPGALAAVRADEVAPLLQALLHTFLDLAAPDQHRMRDLLRSNDSDDVLARAAARAGIELQRDPAVGAWRRTAAEPARRFGAHAQRQAGRWYVGAQPPLGRIDAATLRGVADLASAHGDGSLRITPWQSLLVPNVAEGAVSHVEHGLRSLGFVLDAQHPLARTIACAGSPGCSKGLADTKADALRLMDRLPPGIEAHLSGCVRSCAAAHCAPYTLLAVEPGRYDVYRRAPATRPDSIAARDNAARFGERIGLSLSIDEAAQRLAQSPRN
ncbi:precorrin-3B synthase [Trinickia sp.]|uniref:precorrin-3B synthase n=1 Tax=Trinickia sp. TaxID=2571163 RepID=UPI003F7DEF73